MQLFVRDAATVVLHASGEQTVHELKAMFTQTAYGVEAPEPWLLTLNGQQLNDAATLAAAGVVDGSTLMAAMRVRGGGGDGGSTGAESRSCYLEMYASKKPDKVDPAEALRARWTRCHLSGERLAPPVVADELGSLFNKDAVVQALLHRTMPPALAHITSLKHLISVVLEPSPRSTAAVAAARGGRTGAADGANDADFMCPVTGVEMNGRFRFVVHTPTGRAVSERALKEAPAAVEELLGSRPAPEALLPLNPTGEEAATLRTRVAARVAAEQEKRAKKGKKRAAAEAATAAAAGANGAAGNSTGAAAVGAAPNGVAEAGAKPPKLPRTLVKAPPGATPEVYASIFHKAGQDTGKETYCCRAVSGRPTLTN